MAVLSGSFQTQGEEGQMFVDFHHLMEVVSDPSKIACRKSLIVGSQQFLAEDDQIHPTLSGCCIQ